VADGYAGYAGTPAEAAAAAAAAAKAAGPGPSSLLTGSPEDAFSFCWSHSGRGGSNGAPVEPIALGAMVVEMDC